MRHRIHVATFIALFAFIIRAGTALGQGVPPGPQVVYRTTMEVSNPPAVFDTINLVLDFAPGVSTPLHSHGGQGIVTVLEGELVHRPEEEFVLFQEAAHTLVELGAQELGAADLRAVEGEPLLDVPDHGVLEQGAVRFQQRREARGE